MLEGLIDAVKRTLHVGYWRVIYQDGQWTTPHDYDQACVLQELYGGALEYAGTKFERRTRHPVEKSLVRVNAEKDASYAPYCLRHKGLRRMRKVMPFFWVCSCGAIHDERIILEGQLTALAPDFEPYPDCSRPDCQHAFKMHSNDLRYCNAVHCDCRGWLGQKWRCEE